MDLGTEGRDGLQLRRCDYKPLEPRSVMKMEKKKMVVIVKLQLEGFKITSETYLWTCL